MKQSSHGVKKYKKIIKHKLTEFTQFIHHFSTVIVIGAISLGFLLMGIFIFWATTLKLPSLDTFDERKVAESTKIYDRTGEVILYDIHENIQRRIITGDQISIHAKNAIVAIEDDQFYEHKGINVRSTFRGILYTVLSKVGLRSGGVQGGSTLTQQVVKNTLLTSEQRISRKLKEWFLAVKLEKRLSKDEILTQYLNVAPYGGTIYGIEEASQGFFGKPAIDLTVAESAYLAALPNAPTFYSPYGQNVDKLTNRKNLVLRRMFDLGFIDEETYNTARSEEVVFRPQKEGTTKALHFIQYVRSYLEEKYGYDVIENSGLRVITTLDYELQQKAEDIVRKNAEINERDWNARNQGAIVIDPKTGHILTMVGSRDYFSVENDGNFNVALAKRQPGSAFKPFIYLAAMEKGYTDKTILFDVQTQFSTSCSPYNFSSVGNCYSPQNYDGKYVGPINLRSALAESRNIPAVKLLYLAGLEDSLRTAKNMGISTLDRNANRYGLTLVLGGGEVTLLDMTSAYGVLATEGVRNDPVAILRVEDRDGNVLEEFTPRPRVVINQNAAAIVNSILSDNQARSPLFGLGSFMYFGDSYDVAAKTGTTNDNKDAWLVGYSPSVVVGVWTGNNDNTSMSRGSSISGSSWREIMNEALALYPREYFNEPLAEDDNLKPILRGVWQGGEAVAIDTVSNRLATEFTPPETLGYITQGTPHNILHWVNRADPRGPIPTNPSEDNQYRMWEPAVQSWLQNNPSAVNSSSNIPIPTQYDNVHTEATQPVIVSISPQSGSTHAAASPLTLQVTATTSFPKKENRFFLNGHYVGLSVSDTFTFTPEESGVALEGENTITVTVTDNVYNRSTQDIVINLN